MKRLLTLILPFLLISLVSQATYAQEAFVEGVNYQPIVPAQPTVNPDKVEVTEVFWYRCPHCFRFQPFIERWQKTKPDNVDYVRLPAIIRDDWSYYAAAFYTAQALGVLEKIHEPLFDAIHRQKRAKELDQEENLMKFFAGFGVSNEDFRKTFHSFAVSSKVRRSDLMTSRYHIHGTPSVVVNGKYLVDPGMANNDYATMIKIINYLVEKESNKKG
jgi:thiol:disulfide interchange protein DsbA